MKKRKTMKAKRKPKKQNSNNSKSQNTALYHASDLMSNGLDIDSIYEWVFTTNKQIYEDNGKVFKKCPFMPDFYQLGIDNCNFILPDTPYFEEIFGRSTRKIKENYPVVGISSLVTDLQNQIFLNCQLGPSSADQRFIAAHHCDVLDHFYPDLKAVIEFDSGSFTFDLMHSLYCDPNKRFIFRIKGQELKAFSSMVEPGEDHMFKFHLDPQYPYDDQDSDVDIFSKSYNIRIAKPIIGQKRDGSPKYVTIATDIPYEEVPLDQLTDAYRDRWGGKPKYDHVKNDLLIKNIVAKNLDEVRHEFYASWMIYNMATTDAIIEKINLSILKKSSKNPEQFFEDIDPESLDQSYLAKRNRIAKRLYSDTFKKCKNTLIEVYRGNDLDLSCRLLRLLSIKIQTELAPLKNELPNK